MSKYGFSWMAVRKFLARLRYRLGTSESSLHTYDINSKIPRAGPFVSHVL